MPSGQTKHNSLQNREKQNKLPVEGFTQTNVRIYSTKHAAFKLRRFNPRPRQPSWQRVLSARMIPLQRFRLPPPSEKCPNLGEYTIKCQLHFILNVRGERHGEGKEGEFPLGSRDKTGSRVYGWGAKTGLGAHIAVPQPDKQSFHGN